MKKVFLTLYFVTVMAFIASSAFAQKVTLRYGHANALTYPYHIAGVAFAKAVEEKSKGTLEIKIFPMGQLGGERDITEGLQLGTIDLQGTSLGVTGTFIKVLNIYNLPFIFKGPDHFMKVTHGPIGEWVLKEVIKEGEKVQFKPLSIAGPAFRVPMNNIRPISKLEDFKGLKIRTMEVPLHKDAYKALGSSPTPLPFGELYTALQTGVVDGNENGPATLEAMKFYEVQKYVTYLPVLSNGGAFLMGLKSFNKLSPEHQKVIIECVPVWAKAMDDECLRQDKEALTKMEAKGTKINYIKDLKPYIDATASVRAEAMKAWPKEWADVVEKILKLD
jgi:C4-dicarboxylate-binding protein DctP